MGVVIASDTGMAWVPFALCMLMDVVCVPAAAKAGSKDTSNEPALCPLNGDTRNQAAPGVTVHAPASFATCNVRGAGMGSPATYWNEIGALDVTAGEATFTVKLTGIGVPPTR